MLDLVKIGYSCTYGTSPGKADTQILLHVKARLLMHLLQNVAM